MKTTCPNCALERDASELRPLEETPHLGQRLDPGSVVPLGSCPTCGALVDAPDALVVVDLRGGCVEGVSTPPGVRVHVVDHDEENEEDGSPVGVWTHDGPIREESARPGAADIPSPRPAEPANQVDGLESVLLRDRKLIGAKPDPRPGVALEVSTYELVDAAQYDRAAATLRLIDAEIRRALPGFRLRPPDLLTHSSTTGGLMACWAAPGDPPVVDAWGRDAFACLLFDLDPEREIAHAGGAPTCPVEFMSSHPDEDSIEDVCFYGGDGSLRRLPLLEIIERDGAKPNPIEPLRLPPSSDDLLRRCDQTLDRLDALLSAWRPEGFSPFPNAAPASPPEPRAVPGEAPAQARPWVYVATRVRLDADGEPTMDGPIVRDSPVAFEAALLDELRRDWRNYLGLDEDSEQGSIPDLGWDALSELLKAAAGGGRAYYPWSTAAFSLSS